MNTSTAQSLDCKKMVTVYHSASHMPAKKRDDVNYVAVEGHTCLHTAVKNLVGGFDNKVTLTPVFSGGVYSPNPIGNQSVVAITVIEKKSALELLEKKRMTEKALGLTKSILWGVNRQSFT